MQVKTGSAAGVLDSHRPGRKGIGTARPVDTAPARAKAVKWWAAIGFAYCALAAYAWTRWLTSPNFGSTPPGPDHFGGLKLAWLRFIEFGGTAAALFAIYHWGIKPWRRAGRITTDGILLIAFFLCIFQDPFMNLTQLSWTVNAHHLNFGSWMAYVPGNLNPRANYFVEGLLMESAYVWGLFLPAVLGCTFLRWVRRRRPSIGKLGLFCAAFAFWFVFDFLIEPPLFVFTEIWAYPGVISKLSLFSGTQYQFPLYEPFFMAVLYTGATALRWFLDDRGRTVVERGVDEIRVSQKSKTALRIFAASGAAAAIFFFGYNAPWNLIAVRDDSFPKDMPSYLLDNMCGEGTPYLCPGPGVPANRQPPRS